MVVARLHLNTVSCWCRAAWMRCSTSIRSKLSCWPLWGVALLAAEEVRPTGGAGCRGPAKQRAGRGGWVCTARAGHGWRSAHSIQGRGTEGRRGYTKALTASRHTCHLALIMPRVSQHGLRRRCPRIRPRFCPALLCLRLGGDGRRCMCVCGVHR